MKQTLQFPITLILSLITLFSTFHSISSQPCQRSCGDLTLKYPFGTVPGCGDPRFQHYITCSEQKILTLTTHTGSYPITNIDYTNQVLYISDPTMSTCDCTQPSQGFCLDWDAPFSFHDDTIFALLDCSIDSSPIYKPSGLFNDQNSSNLSLCDNNKGIPICSFLYSCRPISTLNIPISACCVYTPVNFGPSFEMDLEKLKCSSYSGFYSFNGRESDAESWKYGLKIKYKFAINNEYPSWCGSCEKSMGVCGFSGVYNSFTCNCPNGFNTSTDCFFGSNYGHGSRVPPGKAWTWMVFSLAWMLFCIL